MTNYYLVATEEVTLSYWKASEDGSDAVWVENALMPAGTVCNNIAYDGVSPFTPPEGQELAASLLAYNIGDAFAG